MEVREVNYEIYFDGQFQHDGTYDECMDTAMHSLDDDLAEVYKVTVMEEKVY